MAAPTQNEFTLTLTAHSTADWQAFANFLIAALAQTWLMIESSITIPEVTVGGGGGSPGGPVAGAVGVLKPGSMQASVAWSMLTTNFTPTGINGAATHQTQLVQAIAATMNTQFTTWIMGYSAQLPFVGGTLGYMPPGPTVAPGPWVGGLIQPGTMLASGSSTGQVGMSKSNIATVMAGNMPTSLIQGGAPSEALQMVIDAVSGDLAKTFLTWIGRTQFTGFVGTGVASPPMGSVVGVATGGKLQ